MEKKMKTLYVALVTILLFSMLLMPLLSAQEPVSAETGMSLNDAGNASPKDGFLVYLSDKKATYRISADDYVFGVVAACCPADYNTEALKAEAVAAYSLAAYMQNQRGTKQFDLNDTDQGYIYGDALKTKWGDKYEEYKKKVEEAVAAVKGYIITYENKPAYTVRHNISGGNTEKASTVLGQDYPYLTSVESVGDLLAPDYLSEVTLEAAKFKEICTSLECTMTDDPSKYIEGSLKSDVGTVLNYKICGKELTGVQLKNAFQLRSTNFELKYADGKFTFTVKGDGDGVGMSRWGANYMAMQGSSYAEILSWYYPGCTMTKEQ